MKTIRRSLSGRRSSGHFSDCRHGGGCVTPVTYSLDAAGNLTSDGLRTFEYGPDNRLTKVRVLKDGEAASVSYLTNALSQRVFKGEPLADQTLPNEVQLGEGFITWLKKQFGWLFTQAQANTSIGTAYTYGDSSIPGWAVLGEYDNGSATGKGRTEYLWLPLDDGSAIPVGFFRGGQFFAVHTDHLGTPRLVTNEANKPVWQWPYSAFGTTKPTGILRATPNPRAAITNQPVLLKATNPTEFALRFPGQMDDPETGLFNNLNRNYWPMHGAYPQMDPIGMQGGWNRRLYAEGDALMMIDPWGLMGGSGSGAAQRNGAPTVNAFGCMGLACVTGGMEPASLSAELTFGGGAEICDPAPPPPPEQTCRNDRGLKNKVDPPGVPLPTKYGGLFIGASMKRDGRICIRLGIFASPRVPLPSIDTGPMR